MIGTLSTSGHTTYGIKKFILSFSADIDNLPMDCAVGSSALVIENGQVYIYNGYDWILTPVGSVIFNI